MIPDTLLQTKRNKQKYISILRIPQLKIINVFFSDYITMVKLTEYEMRLIAKIRSINIYLNMSREKLLSTLDKFDHITKNLSKCRLNKFAKMHNLSLTELEEIERMNNFSENKLKQITIAKHIKNDNDMSKEVLLIVLLKIESKEFI